MKVRIVGDGELASEVQGYLTIGKVYDAEPHKNTSYLAYVTIDEGTTITVNIKHPRLCGHIFDAAGDLRWEVVDELC
jgi:hypothetical protein